jgi:trans-2,3-dihydro-3-hydroxyanthranilate isomerase
MPEVNYVLADVFTEIAFGGNQLAVFPDGAGFEPKQMQAIARELNLAETTFVTPGNGPGRYRVRIFTPGAELQFAGHPTIGTAVVLAHLGHTQGRSEIVLEEGVGPVRVALRVGGATFFMDGAPETRAFEVPAGEVAAMLGAEAIAGTPWQAGFGTAFVFIQLRDAASVGRSALRPDPWNTLKPAPWGHGVYVHAITREDGATAYVHARMFAPGLGVTEDPATGSAAAALAGSLKPLASGETRRLIITQGVEMGRPSRIETETRFAGGRVTGVSVGGGAVVVGEGRFDRLP